jgi:hypothetical protein
MKTLNIKSNQSIEFNHEGEAFNTDINDPHFPDWALTDFQSILEQLVSSGSSEIHFEDNGFQYVVHMITGAVCSNCSDSHTSNVFVNLEQFFLQYKQNIAEANAASSAEEVL